MSHSQQDEAHLGNDPDPEPGFTWFYSLAGTIMVVVSVFAVAAYFFAEQTAEFDRKVVDQPSLDVANLRASQERLLGEYGIYTVAQPDGAEVKKIRMPIARAFEVMIAESKQPPASTGPHK
ncbi:MAG: hypothetical protein EXS00_00295 [Phycisphaerales bacterium]|nr:hypothetical protein [Phycisphaerales bacterium]